MSAGTTLRIGRREVGLSNPGKVLYPDAGFTKAGVVDYYVRIAPALLPHIKARAMTLKRYPNGVDGDYFFEKNCPAHRPEWVPTVTVASRHREGGVHYCLINEAASLAWVANLASLELHTSLARAKDVTRPTVMVFDFDPGPPAGMLQCIRVASRMRDLLGRLGLQGFPKTSGGKGLHLYVPLNTPRLHFDRTKAFAHALAMMLEREDPALITSVMAKSERPGKVFIDWSQNDEHKTTVSVYSLRARERPTVSTPVTWEELETAQRRGKTSSLVFEAADVLRRVEQMGDLFAPVQTLKQKLPAP
jgi:bifunctional non-homologous end joining protein LigD